MNERTKTSRIIYFISSLMSVAIPSINEFPTPEQRRPSDPRRLFTPRSRGGSTSSYFLPRILRAARKKFDRQNRHAAQRRLRTAA